MTSRPLHLPHRPPADNKPFLRKDLFNSRDTPSERTDRSSLLNSQVIFDRSTFPKNMSRMRSRVCGSATDDLQPNTIYSARPNLQSESGVKDEQLRNSLDK